MAYFIVAVIGAATFCLCWFAITKILNKSPREVASEIKTDDKASKVKNPEPPFNINRSISLGNMMIIPRAADEPFTVIRMQLMPPLEDVLPDRYIINSVLLSFDNGGTEADHNISLKVYLPGVREVSCESDRIEVVEGNLGSTFVNLLVRELKPNEKFSCKVGFTQIVTDIPTVTAWKKRFGPVNAWSEHRQEFDVFIYRMSFGPETPAPAGSGKKTMRAITIHPV